MTVMFARIVSLIALLPMLVHGVLGCCWHHDHGTVTSAEPWHAELARHGHDHELPADHHAPAAPSCPVSPCELAQSSQVILPLVVHFEASSQHTPAVIAPVDAVLCSPTLRTISAEFDLCLFTPQEHCALRQVWLL